MLLMPFPHKQVFFDSNMDDKAMGIIVIILVGMLIISSMLLHGCTNGNGNPSNNSQIEDLTYLLYEIGYEVTNISETTISESIAGIQYLENYDLIEVEEASLLIDPIEDNLLDILSSESIGSEAFLLMIAKEKLRQLLNIIPGLVTFKVGLDSLKLEHDYIYMYCQGNIGHYGLDYSTLKNMIEAPEDERPSLQELYGTLLYEYSKSVEDSYLLNYYDMENSILELDKDSLQDLYEHYQYNLDRIKQELDRINIPDYWSEAYMILEELLTSVEEENKSFFEADWQAADKAELDRTYDSYIKLRKAFWDELDRQGTLFL